MNYLTKKLNKKNRGFTLVELVVVIAIVAILAAIALPQLLGFQDRAKETADKQTAVQLRNAIALLHANSEIGGTGTIEVSTGDVWTIPATITGTANTEVEIEKLTGNIDVTGKKKIQVILGADGSVTQSLVAP